MAKKDDGVVNIHITANGYQADQYGRYIHRLVCEEHHGPAPEGMEVLHLDDDKTNNDPANLRWGTRSENMKMTRGKAKHHKLNAFDVAQIRAFARIKPYGYRPIMAEKFGVSVACIADAAKGRTWV